ncbi:MAG: glycoside hydrolase family protein [Cyanobacteria bacterium P01_G01_bin.67]
MQLATKIKNFFYLCCLILLLLKLNHLSKSDLTWRLRNFDQALTKLFSYWQSHQRSVLHDSTVSVGVRGTQPLVMQGGDPYIRALMRTITASEANVARPYNVLYGGRQIDDLSSHPGVCIAIVSGPNFGKCSTAAGRYQMLDVTWSEKAQKYHPQPSGIWRWQNYSFEAEYQDVVVHNWLSDSLAWGTDIPQRLRQGEINYVLSLLSDTWTSLGYGIETNSMSRYLPNIYQNMLMEELS